MPQRTIRSFSIVIALACLFATVTRAQSPHPIDLPAAIPAPHPDMTIHTATPAEGWDVARSASSSAGRILVITTDKPNRKQSCRVQSFTDEKIVCSRAFGDSRTYLKQQIAALILPGDAFSPTELFIGFNAGLGASIWATVVLVATCPVCAAATAFAALVFFELAGLTAFTDDQPERLLYRAPGLKPNLKYGVN